MIKKRIKKFVPEAHSIRGSGPLRWLGDFLHDSRIWQFNRKSIANACALGMFAMWIPVPLQMLFAAIIALPLRANLPIAIALVWVTNPITIPPMFFLAYLFGAWVLNRELQEVEFEISVEWLTESLGMIWEPFLLGCLMLGVIGSIIGYTLVHLVWRWHIHQHIQKRKRQHSVRHP